MYEEEYEPMYEEDCFDGARYTITYKGYLFYGDSDGWNEHDYNDWSEVHSLIVFYPEIEVRDNYYGVYFKDGEWA